MREELGAAVALVLDGGRCAVGIESTIVDLSRGADAPPRLLRPGRITPEQIEAVIGVRPEAPQTPGQAPRVSGALDAHYAPLTPMRVVTTAELDAALAGLVAEGRSFGLLAYSEHAGQAVPPHALRCLPADPDGYAHGVYAALRELDQAGNELIVVEAIPSDLRWAAVADRLRRATCGAGVA